jgi:hypothetical protein
VAHVSAPKLEQILVGGGADEERLLAAARVGRNKLTAILLSTWKRDGKTLPPPWEAELAAHRDRAERYAETLAIVEAAADVYPVKGARIASAYPRGVERESGDLDLVARSVDDAWRAVDALRPHGWTIEGFALLRIRGEDRPIIELERPQENDLDRVHLATVAFPGHVWGGISPRAVVEGEGRAAGHAFDLLRVVAERLERPFAARDVVDAAVLTHATGQEEAERLWALLDEFTLWPEWRELARRVDEVGLLEPPFDGPVDAERRTRAAKLRRYRSRARIAAEPRRAIAGYAQLRMLQGRTGLLDRTVFRPVRQHVESSTALRYGLPLFGVPLDDDVKAPALVLEARNSSLVAHTPVGAFALTAGEEVAVDD